MKRKKTGWLGTLRNKIWAAIASVTATVGGSTAAYYWSDIAAKILPETANGQGQPAAVVIGALTSLQKSGKVATCDILGSDVRENEEHISIVSVRPGSVGAQLGLMPADIIESVDNQAIHSSDTLDVSLARSRKFFSTSVKVRRGNSTLHGEVHLNGESKLEVRRPLTP